MTLDNPQENPETKSVDLSNATDGYLPKTLDAATDRYLPKILDASKTENIDDLKARRSEARKDRNNWVAALLALALWIVLIYTIVRHLEATISFSQHLFSSNTLDTSDKTLGLEKVQSAVAMVNDTAKTLYSFLGTLVTAVTAYYFKTLLDESNNNDSKDP